MFSVELCRSRLLTRSRRRIPSLEAVRLQPLLYTSDSTIGCTAAKPISKHFTPPLSRSSLTGGFAHYPFGPVQRRSDITKQARDSGRRHREVSRLQSPLDAEISRARHRRHISPWSFIRVRSSPSSAQEEVNKVTCATRAFFTREDSALGDCSGCC